MDYIIEPKPLSGTIDAIASKSAAHRLLIMAALADATCDIDCATTSKDIDATIACLEALGARIARTKTGFRVRPIPQGAPAGGADAPATVPTLDCGESGSTLRFMLPVVCALGRPVRLMGHGRLAERPLSPLYEQLVEHGAVLSPAGTLPLEVSGTLAGGTFELPGDVSSQYVSGLLMAAAALPDDVTVLVSEPVESRAYIDMTVSALAAFGVTVDVRAAEKSGHALLAYRVSGSARPVSAGAVSVEGDWSNAAFWLSSGACGGTVGVRGLDLASGQGDRACLAALAAFGARVSTGAGTASVTHDGLRGRTIEASGIPDLVPPLAGVATLCEGTTRIVGAARLRLKESDRLETVRAALTAMGADVTVEDDGLTIRGRGTLAGGEVDAANDHRIAMMAAICGAHATGPTTIHGAECVQKSYPAFFDDFCALGGIARPAPDAAGTAATNAAKDTITSESEA